MASPSGLSTSIFAYDFDSVYATSAPMSRQLDSPKTAAAYFLCLDYLKLID